MEYYCIPTEFIQEIATCGTFPAHIDRIRLWYDWTDTQKEHALLNLHNVLEKVEEYCKLKDEHNRFFGDYTSAWFGAFETVFNIDCSKQYSPEELLEIVENRIEKENQMFQEELEVMDVFS